MLLTYARAFTITAANIEHVRGRFLSLSLHENNQPFEPEHPLGLQLISALDGVHRLCEEIPSLDKVCAQIERLKSNFQDGLTATVISSELYNLNHRVMDELADHYYYPVTVANAQLYDNPHPFGDRVAAAFPSAEHDIVDAARCLIFDQPTAGAFHMMRALEVALKAFAKKLGVEYKPTWEGYFKGVEMAINKDYPTKTQTEKKNAPLYREILGDLMAVKLAWRNPTMHIERRYQSNEALQVFIASSILLDKIASAGAREKAARSARPLLPPPVEQQ